jgi:hypothetical protein
MTNDPLATTIQKIERACKKQKIPLFSGVSAIPDGPIYPTIEFAGSDWQDYLSFVALFRNPAINLHADINRLTEHEILNVRSPYRDRAQFKRYYESLKTIRDKIGHVACFKLNTFHQGVNYRFSQEADWVTLYQQLNKAVLAMRAKEKRRRFSMAYIGL